MAQTGTLSKKQTDFIEHLLQSPSTIEACRRASVPKRTAYNWLAADDFKRELDAAQRALVSTAARRLSHGLEKSVTTALNLAELSEDEAVRLRAALAIPSMLRDLREHGDILERVTALELAVSNAKH